jgi:regulator of replication initiation timing
MGQAPGDYHQKFWGGGLHVWLSYPEETSPGDSFEIEVHIVSGKFPRGNHVDEVKAKVSVLTDTVPVVLFDDTLILDTYMSNGETFTQSISVTLPIDARWFTTIQMDTVSFKQDLTNRQEAHVTLDSTQVRMSTYFDLEQQIQELQSYNTQLGQQIGELQDQLDMFQGGDSDVQELVDEYIQLRETFDELFAIHEANIEYIEAFESQMGDTISEKDEQIEELNLWVEELLEDNQRLELEVESAVAKLNEYLEVNVTSSEEGDNGEVIIDHTGRNIFLGTTVLSSLIAVALFMRLRK